MLWDIFCHVVDNFGDIGVSWRLSADLASRGETVRLWVDDASALDWMAPGAREGRWEQVRVLPWALAQDPQALAAFPNADVWVEAFGCDVPLEFILRFQQAAITSHFTARQQPVWVNLEYLSAQAYVERSHSLQSPVMSGAAKGWTKAFFYPGFTRNTGGLLRERAVSGATPARDPAFAMQWLAEHGIAWRGERLASLFCYEPDHLPDLLRQLARDSTPTRLLVTAGRAAGTVRSLAVGALQIGNLHLHYLPPLTQPAFDTLLLNCDLNFVRGEDSLVRAIWAGKPFVWNIYPQDDGVHLAKLDAFLGLLELPESVRAFQQQWNRGNNDSPHLAAALEVKAIDGNSTEALGANLSQGPRVDPPVLPLGELDTWEQAVQTLRCKLQQMDDLSTQLLRFVDKNR